jgi:hydroxyacylglutathione hydrolase
VACAAARAQIDGAAGDGAPMSSPPAPAHRPPTPGMIVQRFYDARLAQASYLIGCARTGEAIVIDPNRDAEQYARAAVREELRITHVAETHIHADFVSGTRELAARTGATAYLSDEGDASWKYAFAAADGAVLVKDGDPIRVGNVVLRAMHTPGHTPEHLSYLVTDTAVADEPIAIVTGDFVFVGDVGRPDLLEKAAGVAGTMEASARTLWTSLQRFAALPDWLQVWPGHGAGSACGKGLSAVPHSTVGYEKRYNWAFGVQDEADFVARVLAGQPEPPRYFAHMKQVNKAGPRVLGGFARPARMDDAALATALGAQAAVVDTRATAAYAAGHVPGTINIPLGRNFTTYAGTLLPYDRDVLLIVEQEGAVDDAVRELALIGIERVAGWWDARALHESQRAAGHAPATIPQVDAAELARRMRDGGTEVLDVRGHAEWEAGHLPGVRNVPLGALADHLAELPRDRPLVLHCQGGGRSSIGASMLEAAGFTNVINLTGGFGAWEQAGQPVERPDTKG